MSSDESSDFGATKEGTRGFYDVVSPTILANVTSKFSKGVSELPPQDRESVGGDYEDVSDNSFASISISESGKPRSKPFRHTGTPTNSVQSVSSPRQSSGWQSTSNQDDSSGSSSDLGGEGVGLFGAFEEGDDANIHLGMGAKLVDDASLTAATENAPITTATSELFVDTGNAVLAILNYQEDKLVTHETDCVRVWDRATKKQLLRFKVQVRRIQRYNHWLFCIDTDSEDILAIDMRDDEAKPNRYTGLEEDVTAIAIQNFSGYGLTLFAITRDAFIYNWKCAGVDTHGEEHEIRKKFSGHKSNVTSLDLGSQFLYTSSTDNTVRVWDYDTGKCEKVLEGHTNWVFSVKVINKRVFSGSRDETVRIWSESGDCLSVIQLGNVAYGVMIDGDYLYIRDNAKRIVVFDSEPIKGKNRLIGSCEGSTGVVSNMFIFKNVLLTCSQDDPSMRIWSATSGRQYGKLSGHKGCVNDITLFNTGEVFTAGEDGSIRIWDLRKVFAKHLSDNKTSKKEPRARMKRSGSVFGTLLSRGRTSTGSGSPKKGLRSKSTTAMGGAGAIPLVTPALCEKFRKAMTSRLKTNQSKKKAFPNSFTGKEAFHWLKSNVGGLTKTKQVVAFAQNMAQDGVFQIVNEKVVSSKSILKLN